MNRSAPDTGSGDGDGKSVRGALSRRSLLRTGASIGIASGFAGCAGRFSVPDITSYSFVATPVVLEEPSTQPAYELERLTEETVDRTRSVMGTEVDVELTNHGALYDGTVDTFGLLSSPTANVATQATNPLATDSLREILVSQTGERILRDLSVSDHSMVKWTRGPDPVVTETGTLLGQRTELETFAGVTEQAGFVLITAARVIDAGDVVLAVTAQQRDGDAASLVGANGYVDRETVTASIDRLSAVIPRVKRGGAGAHIVESTHFSTDRDEPNYVRAVVANQYGETTLYAVSLFVQFFDSNGDFMRAEMVSVPSLDPGERFEGVLPYVGDDVAGYAVEAENSSRRIVSEPIAGLKIVSSSRDGDTVTTTIENTTGHAIPYVTLEVTFYSEEGMVLWTQQRTVTDLAEEERRELDVVFAPHTVTPSHSIGDYAVEAVLYGGAVRYVR